MQVPELPLVIEGAAGVEKTKDAIALCKELGVSAELSKSDKSKKVRAGRGKTRNRRYTMRKGPLVVYTEEEKSLEKAFRNIPGVDLCCVTRLNLLQLAPGGTFGRFVIYTKASVEKLGAIFGTYAAGSELKKGYTLPRSIMTNTDIARIINSDEIQSVLLPAKVAPTKVTARKNPLKNKKIAAMAHDKSSIVAKKIAAKKTKNAAKTKKHVKAKKTFFKSLQDAYKAPVVE